MTMTAEQLRDRADRLNIAARGHIEASRRHRKRAKRLFAEMTELIAAAAERGITINITKPNQGGQSERNQTEEADA